MRLVTLLLFTTYLFASDFPGIFSSSGDKIYQNMEKYQQIKELNIYKDRPELLEAFCIDANKTMQKGFALDKVKDNIELSVDKGMIKSYAKELRMLEKQNNKIRTQLNKDIEILYKNSEFKALRKISEAGFVLGEKMVQAIKDDERKEELAAKLQAKEKVPAVADKEEYKEVLAPVATVHIPLAEPISVPIPVPAPAAAKKIMEQKKEPAVKEKPTVKKSKPTELEYYKISLASFKEELYALREAQENNSSEEAGEALSSETKMACLNDITAMNYWMISALENKKDSCLLRDAIRQMKSYDKASMNSCGRESIRYVEWHGRIKPYVGKKLFEAEAGCSN